MAEFLLELFSEEIPARMQARAAEDLKSLVTDALKAAGLAFDRAEAFVTPRRLALVIDGLPAVRPDVAEERKGPKVDAPQQAIDGFLKATGLTLEQCEQRDTPKGKIWFASLTIPGGPTADLLPEVIRKAILGLPWPKSMRAAEQVVRWVRPLHHVLALFDGQVVPFRYDLHKPDIDGSGEGAKQAVGSTVGHRFLAPGRIAVTGFADYKAKLLDAYVVLDREERKTLIRDQVEGQAKAAGLTLRDDPGLLEEVAGLVEWPVAYLGRIDDAFMTVPEEVLVTSMRTHQRYFALEGADGKLAARFAVVANTETRDNGATVIDGNERVLRARLSDAKFFWDQDRKTPLESRIKDLEPIIFHARLGSVAQKVERLAALAWSLAPKLGADPAQADRAARLAKADLTTGMVGEFPELQGLMGRYYALAQGEAPDVAEAIADHYKPVGPGDRCPTAPVSIAVALADKLDTLAGFFAIDEKPTGSRDPYALRRAALGVIRLIDENGVTLSLRAAFGAAWDAYRVDGLRDKAVAVEELLSFIADRLKVAMREKGVRHDLIDAVFAVGGEDDLLRLLGRVKALAAFLGSEDGANLLTAYRRAGNIGRIERKKDGVEGFGEVDASRFAMAEERALFERLEADAQPLKAALAAGDFAGAMATLAGWRPAVDAFFDGVLVNDPVDDLRRNRLALLDDLTSSMNDVADFSRVEG
ncbi:glycine--tRNA ligase subunit beta [Mycobacterium sp. KBS0706]|uniref:glycine--tRNA ligase subunit beta n=1 Tax=Mycobacterium sp. KBS0706 TaxID=2578109 RepID=UPI00110F7913|nr:glycine--tRNA ligase subunit beta [Mycobacterium sp. KBS0706]TSD87452.1 glycine--tRNA ligase subunit beta [Mycobacterium sp. KBS0706]